MSTRCCGYEMFDEMTAAIQEDTVRMLYHVRVEQKVEREAGSQSDRNQQRRFHAYRLPRNGKPSRFIPTIRAPAEAERNTNSAAEESLSDKKMEKGRFVFRNRSFCYVLNMTHQSNKI